MIFNDNAFGNVRRLQADNWGGRYIANELASPDFVKYAEAFGAQSLRATTPDELRARLRERHLPLPGFRFGRIQDEHRPHL